MLRSFLISFLLTLAMGDAALVPQPLISSGAPQAIAHNIPAGSHFSRNWSGYIARHGTYTGVGATWRVPTVHSSPQTYAADATWVGIGGSTSDDLLQAGTQAIVENGRVTYEAWIEMLPEYLERIPLRVHPGDSVSVSLSEVSSGMWEIRFRNNTTGAQYHDTVAYASSHSSAEWVEEAPMQASGDLIPLDNFGSVTFTGAYAIGENGMSFPGTLKAEPITMVDENTIPLAVPSELSQDTFSVARDTIAL